MPEKDARSRTINSVFRRRIDDVRNRRMIESYQRLKLLGNRYQELLEEVAISKSAEQRMQLLHQLLLLLDDLEEIILKTLRDELSKKNFPEGSAL